MKNEYVCVCDRDSGRYGEMRETAETEFSISELKRDSLDPLGFSYFYLRLKAD